jgi:hypothetical protein
MGRCAVRPVDSVAIRKQVMTIARIIEPGLSQTNNVNIRGTNIVIEFKLFSPEASNVLIVDAVGIGMRLSQACHVTDIAIGHDQTVGYGSTSATSSSPVGSTGEMEADGIPASGATGVKCWSGVSLP